MGGRKRGKNQLRNRKGQAKNKSSDAKSHNCNDKKIAEDDDFDWESEDLGFTPTRRSKTAAGGSRKRPSPDTGENEDGGGTKDRSYRWTSMRSVLVVSISLFASLYATLIGMRGKKPFWISSFEASDEDQSQPVLATSKILPNTKSKDEEIHIIKKDNAYGNVLTRNEPIEPKWNKTDPTLNRINDFLSNYVCNDGMGGYCHPSLSPAPNRRTHQATMDILPGTTVLNVPRNHLIWDLDAMRDPFLQNNLFGSRHADTGNPLDSGAFLAAHLIRRYKILKLKWWSINERNDLSTHYNEKSFQKSDHDDQRILKFLEILPTYTTLQKTHPTLWSQDELTTLLGGKQTPSYNLIQALRTMMLSEYKAFTEQSTEFLDNVSVKEYLEMRLNVMSRSFGTGPPGPEEELISSHDNVEAQSLSIKDDGIIQRRAPSLEEELEKYRIEAGVDLSKGCRAMSPILDMYDHHALPNVQWRYHGGTERSFVITAGDEGIQAGSDVMVSYGTYTDTYLFSKFGFVNGDGSGYTEASLDVLHRILDVGLGAQFSYLIQTKDVSSSSSSFKMVPSPKDSIVQKRQILRYLTFDDGYAECIQREENPDGYSLKLLKYHYLLQIANIRERWTLRIPPRNPSSKPSQSSHIPIITHPPRYNNTNLKFDGSKLISTCRLISLTNNDYDGKALEVLSGVLRNKTADTFLVERLAGGDDDTLELRALTCLTRLTNAALKRYQTSVAEDMRLLTSTVARPEETLSIQRQLQMERNSIVFGSKEWTTLQVRMGEMQTLEVLRSIASSGAKQMMKKIRASDGRGGSSFTDDSSSFMNDRRQLPPLDDSMPIRQKACPLEYTSQLLND